MRFVKQDEFDVRLNEFLEILNQFGDSKMNEVKKKLSVSIAFLILPVITFALFRF